MKNKLSTQILSFLVVGGLSTLIDFAIVYGLPEQKHQEFLLFLILSLLGLALTAGLMWVAVDAMHWPVMPAKVAVTAVVMVFNFLTRKLLLEK